MLLKVINLSKRPPWMVESGWIMSGRIHRKLFLSIKSSIPRLFAPPESNDASAGPFNGLPFDVNVARRDRERRVIPFNAVILPLPSQQLSNSSFRACNGKTGIGGMIFLFSPSLEANLKEISKARKYRAILSLFSSSSSSSSYREQPSDALHPPNLIPRGLLHD